MTQYEYYTTLLRYILEAVAVTGLAAIIVCLIVFIVIFRPFLKK